MRRYLLSSLVAIGLLPLVAAAAYAEPSVAVLGLEPIGVPEALAQQLTDALRQRASGTQGIRALPGKDLIEIKMIFNCDAENPTCMAVAGKSLGADKLLYGTLKKAGGRDHNSVIVGLKLLDVRSATVEKFINETVSKRELAAGNVNGSAAKWFGELVEVAKPSLTVTSDPTGGAVTVDGAPMGRTPVTLRDLSPGAHLLVVTLPGRMPYTRNIELKPGGSHEVVAQLDAEKVVTPPRVVPPVIVVKPPEPAIVTPPVIVQQPPPERSHPGRTARILAFSAVGAAVVTGSIAIYTWRTYDGLQTTAHGDLVALKPGMPTADQVKFFGSPNCSPPASLGSSAAVTTYKNDCSRGESFAGATTALWVVTGTLAAAGIVGFIVGDRQAAHARAEHSPSTTAQIIRQTLTVAPVFSTSQGGVQAAFQF